MWSMILLMPRLPGGHSIYAGQRPENLGYQQSAVSTTRRLVPTNAAIVDWVGRQHLRNGRGTPALVHARIYMSKRLS